jgi:adenosylcobinamide-phosphate synthase
VSAAASHFLVLLAALVLDRFFGDPDWLWRRVPHPVALMGRLIAWLEERLNDPALSAAARQRRGVAAMAVLALGAAGAGALIAPLLGPTPLGGAVEATLVAILLAHKSLLDHAAEVARRLRDEGLPGGREAVSHIVGRDVSVLDESGVARAAIESAAENFSDGVVAPVFWYALFGLPGLIVFKVASTADSMIGHRSARYAAFGWAAARLDDLLNLVPARLSALLIAAAALFTGRDAGTAAASAWRDARLHKSPNAGWPEAAAAGALGLALGGPRRYGEFLVEGAWLNGSGRAGAGPEDLETALKLIDAAWVLLTAIVAFGAVIALAIGR